MGAKIKAEIWTDFALSLGLIFPRGQSVSGHVVQAKMFPACSPRIHHRNELTERNWENAV